MNTIECQLCLYKNSLSVINKECEKCKATILYNKNISNQKELSHLEHYKRLINELSLKVGLEESIIKKMIDLNLFDDFKTKKEINISGINYGQESQGLKIVDYPNNIVIIFISKNLCKISKKSALQIFLNYNIHDNNYYLKNESIPYLYSKIDNTKFLTANKNFTYDNSLYLLIKYEIQELSPYPIEWLNDEEKLLLSENIDFSTIKKISIKEEKETINCFGFYLSINEEDELETIYLSIEDQINKLEKYYNQIKVYLKEKNKFYFKRALLEREIQNF